MPTMIDLKETQPCESLPRRLAEYVKTIPKGKAVLCIDLAKEWGMETGNLARYAPKECLIKRKIPGFKNSVTLLVCPNQ